MIITEKEINNFIIPYKVNDTLLYQRSFITQGYYEKLSIMGHELTKKGQVFEKSNETLELVGDSIVNFTVVEYLQERFPDEREGFLSKLKINIVKSKSLALFARKLGFDKHLLITNEMEMNDSILEDCFEAFVGALYKDYKQYHGIGKAYEVCHGFIVSLIEKYLDFSTLTLVDDNYKSLLQAVFHLKRWPLPTYTQIDVSIINNSKIYTTGVYINRHLLSENEINKIMEYHKNNKTKYKIIKDYTILLPYGSSSNSKESSMICAKNILQLIVPNKLKIELTIDI